MSVRRACCTSSVFVFTWMRVPGSGSSLRAQAADMTRSRLSFPSRSIHTSTQQTRHTPAGAWGGRWHTVGMVIPSCWAASKIVVWRGTRTTWPSIVTSISSSLTRNLRPRPLAASDRYRLGSGVPQVGVHFVGKVLQHRRDRGRRELPEAADRGLAERQLEVFHQLGCGVVGGAFGHRLETSASFSEPTRHGQHLPHDSRAKKRATFSAGWTIQRPSATATIALHPHGKHGYVPTGLVPGNQLDGELSVHQRVVRQVDEHLAGHRTLCRDIAG